MKTWFHFPGLILCVLFSQSVMSQADEQAIIAHQTEISNFRNLKNQLMLNPESTPLTPVQLEKYKGLNYFPIDYKYNIEAKFVPDATPKPVSLNTSAGGKSDLTKVGNLTFVLDGKSFSLAVFRNNNLPEFAGNTQQLFIPFTDLNTGKESTSVARYLAIDTPGADNKIRVDFNKAINPFSTYNNQYFSILAPPGNNMSYLLVAGERKYEDR